MAYGALDPWDEQQQQDDFTSSFFQQPPSPFGGEKRPASERRDGDEISVPHDWRAYEAPSSPSMGGMDSFASSVFGSGTGAMQGMFAPGTGADLVRRSAPAEYGISSGSSRQPPSSPTAAGTATGASSGGTGFDYGSLVNKVQTSANPRARAVAQDQLARATYAQLKNAGHDVSWEGDNLVVDGRPYVVGDGAPAAPAPSDAPTAAAPSGKTAPTNGPSQDHYTNATGRTQGGATTPQEAYDRLSARLDPNASREEMEAAIEEEFGHLPGYGGAYKESVMLNGRWYDMVTGFGAAGASWGGLTPKGPSKSASSSMFGNSFLNSLSPVGGGTGSVAGALPAEGARGVELSAGLNPAILAYLQQPEPQEQEPMSPSYMNLLQTAPRAMRPIGW